MRMFRKDEGFTLVELMVVVLIIGILVAIAVPVFLNASASAQAKSCQANQRTVLGAFQTYNAAVPAAPITGTAGTKLLLGNAAYANLFTGANQVIRSVPKCPVGGDYVLDGIGFVGDSGGVGAPVWLGSGATSHQLQ
jgi:prepilin-type N-terminal cleavage/methylation domain-containing protein